MTHFHGLELELRTLSGAAAIRVVHPSGQRIDCHRHDWPSLTLHIAGGCTEAFDDGEFVMAGPSAILHPAGAAHGDAIHADGMETISLRFDPAWLSPSADPRRTIDRSLAWRGGRVGLAARKLASLWADAASGERRLAAATSGFLDAALRARPQPQDPAWLSTVRRLLALPHPPRTIRIAEEIGLHPAWLARAYRRATGEGIHETINRRRVQAAIRLLRETELPLSEISYEVGFCDQGHMSRAIRAVCGRTPLRIRQEAEALVNVA